MSDEYVEQPDGRLVAGPPREGPAPDRTGPIRFLVVCLVLLLIPVAFFVGRSTTSSDIRALQSDALAEGCLPAVLIAGFASSREEAAYKARTLAANIRTIYGDAKNIDDEVVPVPPDSAVRDTYPTAEYLSVVHLDRCLPGA